MQIGQMEILYANAELGDSDRMHICFALAKAHEDLCKYEKSFNYLKQANELRKKEVGYNIENDRNLIIKIKGFFSDEGSVFDMVPKRHSPIKPIFIVGMPRSGTSLVEQILSSHAEVYGAGELVTMDKLITQMVNKLPVQCLNQDSKKIIQDEINTLHDNYLMALASFDVPEKIITDKMPHNFMWLGFILSAFPGAKIINLKRDPMATCWSIYKHYFSTKGNGYAYDIDDLAGFYKLYRDLMSFWRKRFSRNIYDLCYEDLTVNQEIETRKLLLFCDLEWEPQCLEFHKTKRTVKTASAGQVRKEMYKGSSEAWKKYEPFLQPLLKLINGLNS